eukprot:TRINITY_DN70676_c0_g1_i1.p1 TRINITY_DN70676_c0_g1~~TRINITY_DN70676_c0_g1_i1.p1  ORF type:complete len:1018 (+),score=433.62 TRINITY_DN70676_c0_g1_i1:77-3055(+)
MAAAAGEGAAAPGSAAGGGNRRKVDNRVKVMLENGAALKHRSLFLLVGDRGRDQLVNLHAMVSRAKHQAKVDMLWCYKTELSFGGGSKRKRAAKFKKDVDRGIATAEQNSAFEVWLQQTKIRFCYYKDTHKILGQTFGMLVLQDFEALTPNLLARTMETVEGGGLVVILIRTLRSLKQLYTLTMDVHARYRSAQHGDVVPRFNERFILSLADCRAFLCVNDRLEVLPFTSNVKEVQAVPERDIFTEEEKKLRMLQDELKSNTMVGPLIKSSMTLDQATAVLGLMETVAEKSLSTTVTVTAARGRGKSAALGLAVAGAISQGYSNIFVTSPSPENLITFFQFVVKGLEEFGYKEREDFEIVQAEAAEMARAVIRVSVFRSHRQTVQYLLPQDSAKFGAAELLVVDEAAAIPLPLLRALLGPYLIFLSSTITGYEGTGRALSLKLFNDLRSRARAVAAAGGAQQGAAGRGLKELSLEQPCRYGSGDPLESWLHKVLCLDADVAKHKAPPLLHPDQLDLFFVERDTLFSYHAAAEELLQRIVALYVSSHYKNQPNDLQLLSDAPGHNLFVLLDAKSSRQGSVPDVYAVIQVSAEGNIKHDKLESDLGKGTRPSGDLIPYTLAQNFQEPGFGELRGLRVVRIAVHPEMQRQGYGGRALRLLLQYYEGELHGMVTPQHAPSRARPAPDDAAAAPDASGGCNVEIAPRKDLPHLLHRLGDRPPEECDYIGTSFGLTTELYSFWAKANFRPVYLRQVANDLTGEHSAIMLRGLAHQGTAAAGWVRKFGDDFAARFLRLLPLCFRRLPVSCALSIAVDRLQRADSDADAGAERPLDEEELLQRVTEWDLRRLSAFSRRLVDQAVVLDLVPEVAALYFAGRLGRALRLPMAQAAVLLAFGLQGRTTDEIRKEPEFKAVESNQVASFFAKALGRISQHFDEIRSGGSGPEDGPTDALQAATGGAVPSVVSLPRQRPAADADAQGGGAAAGAGAQHRAKRRRR